MTANPNILPSEQLAVLEVIDADAYTANTYTTGWIDMSTVEAILACIAVGDLGTNATVDAKLEQATDSGGSGAKDITGKAITQLTDAGSDSNKQALINCRANELDVNNNFTHARLSVTVAVATSDAAAFVLGMYPRYGYADGLNAASVDETVK